jgi:small subunit ribosomal protein S20
MRQTEKKRQQNRVYRGSARKYVKEARTALDKSDLDLAREQTLLAISTLDRSVSKGVLHKNNAARRKSRLLKLLAKHESKASVKAEPKASAKAEPKASAKAEPKSSTKPEKKSSAKPEKKASPKK